MRVRYISKAITLAVCLGAIVFAGIRAQTGPVPVVVANPSVPDYSLSRDALRAIFAMRYTVWSDGSPIDVYVLPDNQEPHRKFCKMVLSIYPHNLRRVWDRLVFSGTGNSPNVVESQAEMRAAIASTPGAIGYLYSDQVDDTVIVLEVR